MKRYLLFAGDHYYPSGGWNDFVGSFDTAREAMEWAESKAIKDSDDWAHVVDTAVSHIHSSCQWDVDAVGNRRSFGWKYC